MGVVINWFTADLHLGHRNIINYCGRPFGGPEEMNAELVRRWNETVEVGDTVWVLGDLALGRITDSVALVGRLAGRKLLLAGNHDRCWHGHGRRAAGWTQRYLEAGFAEVHQGEIRLLLGGMAVLGCHFPYSGDSHDTDRYVEHRPVDRGDWLLHGHVHQRWLQRGRMINVGVDVWDYRPVSEQDLVGLVSAGPRDLPEGSQHPARPEDRSAQRQ